MNSNRSEALKLISQRKTAKAVNVSEKTSELFGSGTFGIKEVEKRLSKDELNSFLKTVNGSRKLELSTAEAIATAVRKWAVSEGVTHFTHWFQPHTGLTAEKHDSFLSFDKKGNPIERFSASQLIQSEPDASSFPSGGMRATFEARGYTAWDVSSPIFITERAGSKILCIPSVFVTYTGHSLDTKTGLLRSMDAVENSTKNFLKTVFKSEVQKIKVTVGVEQEYFLIDRAYYHLRPDLILTGRTLLGGDMPKGQQLEDHYFGSIPTRAMAFMADTETELYKLGIPCKTRHNEVAPGQFELAPIFEDANIAADHNMLTMEVFRRTAEKHDLYCLFHEKPFEGVNGSGKHNNWSLSTGKGENLLEPGKTPSENLRFLAVLSCVLKAVFDHQVAMRASIASHGNDHRLGANEAPPAIMSVFLGSTLTEILQTIERGESLSELSYEDASIDFGINQLPMLPKDNTDRNRTSPFAFTGNKFEFRAVGSSQTISFPMAILNAAVAKSMNTFSARYLEVEKTAKSPESALLSVVQEFIKSAKAICFEGDGYSDEWRNDAISKGLYELLTLPDAINEFVKEKHSDFLVKTGVYSRPEFDSIMHVRAERYVKHLHIEAETTNILAVQYVLPAAFEYQSELATTIDDLKDCGIDAKAQKAILSNLSNLTNEAYDGVGKAKEAMKKAEAITDPLKASVEYGEVVLPLMEKVRKACDVIATIVPDESWPLPKYREMLFIK